MKKLYKHIRMSDVELYKKLKTRAAQESISVIELMEAAGKMYLKTPIKKEK